MDPVLEELRDILSAYSSYDVAIPFLGAATGRHPVWHVSVTARMRGECMRQDTPEHWREDAISRVHEMLADLEDHLWVRTDSPDIQFRGTIMQPARITIDGKLAERPVEGMLECEASFELDRLTGKLSEPAPSGATA